MTRRYYRPLAMTAVALAAAGFGAPANAAKVGSPSAPAGIFADGLESGDTAATRLKGR